MFLGLHSSACLRISGVEPALVSCFWRIGCWKVHLDASVLRLATPVLAHGHVLACPFFFALYFLGRIAKDRTFASLLLIGTLVHTYSSLQWWKQNGVISHIKDNGKIMATFYLLGEVKSPLAFGWSYSQSHLLSFSTFCFFCSHRRSEGTFLSFRKGKS